MPSCDTARRRPRTLVAFHARNGVHALNVLTGAVRSRAETANAPIRFATSRDSVIDEVRAALARDERPLVAWSFYSPEAEAIYADLAAVRAAVDDPRVLHVAGGVHATAEPADTLRAGFDLVAIGEGEETIVALLGADDPARVTGIGRLESGVYRSTGAGARVALDDWPAFNAVDHKYNAIEITRGCIYACAFCQTPFMFKARFRHRSIENVRAHVRIMRREGLRYVRFVTPTSLSYGTDDLAPNLDAVDALLAAVREEIGPDGKIYFGTFPSEVRPEHVTPAAMAVLRKWVDNDNLVIGGQSGSQRVLDETRRDHAVEDVVRAVRVAIDAGFRPNVDFLFGLPSEGADDARATVDLMRSLVDDGARVHAHAFMPLPGTPLKDAPAGDLDDGLRRAIGELEARGRAYGQWRKQLVAASSLVRRRA